jgi:hypothetical protein
MSRKLILASVVLLASVSLVGATTLVRMDFGDLARDADAIIVGTVTDIQGEWGPDRNFIHSNVTIRVERSMRGNTGDQIVLRNPGGIVAGVGQRAEGVADFEVGERVMLFLTSWEDGALKVLGYTQGKSRVVVDGQGRERLVGGSSNGMSVKGAALEIVHGTDRNIPLRPKR